MSYPRILIVDEEENFLNLFSKVLGKEGYEVRTELFGDGAMRLLEKEPFDLALIDHRVIPARGLSLLELIKKQFPRTKVIIMTAYPNTPTEEISYLKGAAAYLAKPIDLDHLKETVREHLFPPSF